MGSLYDPDRYALVLVAVFKSKSPVVVIQHFKDSTQAHEVRLVVFNGLQQDTDLSHCTWQVIDKVKQHG